MAQPDPSELLLRVRDTVVNTLNRLPRYMCTQTIDRSQYEPDPPAVDVKACNDRRPEDPEPKLVRTNADRVRLDVGIAERGEIYSWVGENRFGNQSLFQIVNEGSVSTGYFEGFLELVFRGDNASFSYSGEISEGGRSLMEYGYRVPLEASHYVFRFPGQSVTTAYEGTLLVDPQTAELVRLTLRTDGMPPETGACEVNNTMNYNRFRLNGSDFLLPLETRLHIKGRNGVEMENLTVYSGCHEFLGESTLNFDTPPDAPAPKSTTSRPETVIPAGLPFRLALTDNIHVATAAAGETVKAVLTADLRDQAKTVLIQRGTPVICRILRIRRWYGHGTDARALDPNGQIRLPPNYSVRVELLLRLEDFALPGGQQPVYAQPDRVGIASLPRPGTLKSRPMELGPLNAMGRNQWSVNFLRAGDDYVIKSGLASNWVTVAQ